MSDLAAKLVNEWAADRLTQPTPAELDLARWILERAEEDPEMALAKAALDSWQERLTHIKAAIRRESETVFGNNDQSVTS